MSDRRVHPEPGARVGAQGDDGERRNGAAHKQRPVGSREDRIPLDTPASRHGQGVSARENEYHTRRWDAQHEKNLVASERFPQTQPGTEEEDTVPIFVPGAVFILHPYSRARLCWDVYMIILLMYTVFDVPYKLSFAQSGCHDEVRVSDVVISWLVDGSFWLDILLNFNTAYVDVSSDAPDKLSIISERRSIAQTYLRGWFWLDLAGSIPLVLIEEIIAATTGSPTGGGCGGSASRILKLNRLARLVRLVKLLRLARLARFTRMISSVKDALGLNPGHIALMQWVIFVLALAHMLACLLYGMISFQTEFEGVGNWASGITTVVPGYGHVVMHCPDPVYDDATNQVAADSPSRIETTTLHGNPPRQVVMCLQEDGTWIREADAIVKYMVTLYLTFTMLTTVGYGDITMLTMPEVMLSWFMITFGASTFAMVVGTMTQLLGKLNSTEQKTKEFMEELDHFMHQENLPLDVRFRIRTFYEFGFSNSLEIPAQIDGLSSSLRTEVALHLYSDLISAVPFLKDCGKNFLTEIILRLEKQTLSPGDYLYEAGEPGDSMHFLERGVLHLEVDSQNGIFAELTEGIYVGEKCALGLSSHRQVSVRATAWSSLYSLSQESLETCLSHHPDAVYHFRSLITTTTTERIVTRASIEIQLERAHRNNETDHVILELEEALRKELEPINGEPPVFVRAMTRQAKSRGSMQTAGSPHGMLRRVKVNREATEGARRLGGVPPSPTQETYTAEGSEFSTRCQSPRQMASADLDRTGQGRELGGLPYAPGAPAGGDPGSALLVSVASSQARAREERMRVRQEMEGLQAKLSEVLAALPQHHL